MNTKKIVFRKALERDVDFMSEILIDAAAASGVNLSIHDLSRYPDTYQYVQGFPEGSGFQFRTHHPSWKHPVIVHPMIFGNECNLP